MITGKQLRAARALAGWEAHTLATEAKLSSTAILQIERGEYRPRQQTVDKIVRAFTDVGIEFTDNEGVRKRPHGIKVFQGPEQFDAFYDFLYDQLRLYGGDVCFSVTDERLFAKYRKNSTLYYERMQDLYDRKIIKSFRILANQSNFSMKYPYNTYKWLSDASISPTAFATFADCLALMSFVHDTPPYVVVIQSAPIASSYRQAFDRAWDAASEPPSFRKAKK